MEISPRTLYNLIAFGLPLLIFVAVVVLVTMVNQYFGVLIFTGLLTESVLKSVRCPNCRNPIDHFLAGIFTKKWRLICPRHCDYCDFDLTGKVPLSSIWGHRKSQAAPVRETTKPDQMQRPEYLPQSLERLRVRYHGLPKKTRMALKVCFWIVGAAIVVYRIMTDASISSKSRHFLEAGIAVALLVLAIMLVLDWLRE